jgi:hypothetical protein
MEFVFRTRTAHNLTLKLLFVLNVPMVHSSIGISKISIMKQTMDLQIISTISMDFVLLVALLLVNNVDLQIHAKHVKMDMFGHSQILIK